MNNPAANTELDHALEFAKRIEAMINAPHWTSERRQRIGECARKAQDHIEKAKECLTKAPSTTSTATE